MSPAVCGGAHGELPREAPGLGSGGFIPVESLFFCGSLLFVREVQGRSELWSGALLRAALVLFSVLEPPEAQKPNLDFRHSRF